MAYKEDAEIKLTGKQFETILLAVNHGIDALTEHRFEEKTMWVKKDTGEPVNKPTKKQIEDGKVVQTIDIDGTFTKPTRYYGERITQQMIEASLLVNRLHKENIDNGIFKVEQDAEQSNS